MYGKGYQGHKGGKRYNGGVSNGSYGYQDRHPATVIVLTTVPFWAASTRTDTGSTLSRDTPCDSCEPLEDGSDDGSALP